MTQQEPQKVSDMVRTTVNNTSDFFTKLADHIDYLENTVLELQQKLAQYEELSEREIDDFK